MTLGLYAKALRTKQRRPHARRREEADEWARMGTNAVEAVPAAVEREAA
jgi:hypothetical protein